MLKLSLFLHIIAAMFWVGGMLFLTAVIVPFLRTIPDSKERSSIYQIVGRSFRFWGWVSIITLLITGGINLYTMGIYPSVLIMPEFHYSAYGRTLEIKLALVTTIIISSFLHDFVVGPLARESTSYSRMARWMGRSNLLIAILIALFAVFLRLGGI